MESLIPGPSVSPSIADAPPSRRSARTRPAWRLAVCVALYKAGKVHNRLPKRAPLVFCFLLFAGRGQALSVPVNYLLPNGLRVVMQERHLSPLIGVDLWVQAGAREETQAEAGSAHFLEHTLFKGTSTYGPGETDIAIENLGASLHAATGPDYAHFYTTVATQHLPEVLHILADIARNATLPTAEIDRERGVILDELAQRDSERVTLLMENLYAAGFASPPYRRSPGGRPDDIRHLSRETLLGFYRRNYQPGRCILALAGDLQAETARTAVSQAFGDWNPPHTAMRTPTSDLSESDSSGSPFAPRHRDLVAPRGEAALGLAFPAPAAKEADKACAAQVFAALLGQAQSTGLLSTVAPEEFDVEVRFTPRLDSSLFILLLQPSGSAPRRIEGDSSFSARLSALERLLLARLTLIQALPPSLESVSRAKQQVLGTLDFETETNAGLARALGYAALVGGDDPTTFRQRLQRLNPIDLQHFAQLTFASSRRISVFVLPTQKP